VSWVIVFVILGGLLGIYNIFCHPQADADTEYCFYVVFRFEILLSPYFHFFCIHFPSLSINTHSLSGAPPIGVTNSDGYRFKFKKHCPFGVAKTEANMSVFFGVKAVSTCNTRKTNTFLTIETCLGHQEYKDYTQAHQAMKDVQKILDNGGRLVYSPKGSAGINKNEYVKIEMT